MKQIENFRDITTSANKYESITPGGYICRITGIKDYPQKEYLEIEYDIAEGKYSGYYLNILQKFNFWGARFIRSYKQSAIQFFKAFIDAIELSNKNYYFNFDEKTLINKYIGLVLGEEEYKSKNGEIKKRLYVYSVKTVKEIKEGKFKVPDFKYYKNNVNTNTNSSSNQNQNTSGYYEYDQEENDDDLPF